MGASVKPVDPLDVAWQAAQKPAADPLDVAWQQAQTPRGGGSSLGDGSPQEFGTGSTILNRLQNTLKGAANPVAARVLSAAQLLPGMETFEAGAGALGSHIPGAGPPLSFGESRDVLRGEIEKIPAWERIGEQMAASLPLMALKLPAAVASIPAIAKMGPKSIGAAWGAAHAALAPDDESPGARLAKTAAGGVGGAITGAVADLAGTALQAAHLPTTAANRLARKAATAEASGPLYDQFRDLGDLGETPALKEILDLPVIQKAISTVKGESPTLNKLADTDARVLDAVYKRVGNKAFKMANGFETDEARQSLMGAIEEAAQAKGGSYANAVGTFREGAQGGEAVARGKATLAAASAPKGPGIAADMKTSPEAFQAWLKTATPEQAAAAREGILGGLKQQPKVSFGRILGTPAIPLPSRALRAAPDLVRAASLKAGRTAADALGDYINPWSPKP